MKKTVNEKTTKFGSKGKTARSKKLSLKMKAVIYSVVAVVCCAAITLGLVFGLKKPGGPANYKFSASQQILANEINSNVKYDVFDIVDSVPYSKYTAIDNLTRYGDSYFAYTDASGNEQFYVYYEDAEGEIQTRCLTDEQGFIDKTALSWSVEKMNGDYLMVANYYTTAKYNEEITSIRYDLVSIVDPANPKVIFQFDTRGMGCHVNKSDIVLKDNYFALTYIDNINYENQTVDYNTYFYAYSDEFISHSPNDENNFVSGLTQTATDRVRRVFNDSGFAINKGTSQTYYYLSNGEFNSFEREIVIDNNSQVDVEWNFIELSPTKLLVEKVSYLDDPSSATATTVKTESSEELGSYTYSNKSYELFNIKNGVAENMNFAFKSGYSSAGKLDVTDKMINSAFAIAYQKVGDDNVLANDFLIVYYDANGNEIVSYLADSAVEQIVYASNNTYITTKNILQPQNNVSATKLFDFSNKDYFIDTRLSVNSEYIVLTNNDDTLAGVVDVWGNLILDPETSGYSKILDLVDGRCVAFDVSTEKGYTVDLKTGVVVELEDYDRNPLITGSGTGLNIAKDGSAQLSQIKNIYGTVVAENVTELKFPTSLNGHKVIEVWTNNDGAKASAYVVFNKVGTDETASFTSYTNPDNISATQQNVSSAYTETIDWSVANGMITEMEDPSYSINFTQTGTGISTTGNAWFGAKLDGTTYKLADFKSYSGPSYQTRYDDSFTVSYTNSNSASFVTAPHGYGYNWKYNYSWTFDFSCWVWVWESYADYISTGGSNLAYVTYDHHIYFKTLSSSYTYDSNANRVNQMTTTHKTVTTDLSTAQSTSYTTGSLDNIKYGHSKHWLSSGTSAGDWSGHWYGPSSYNNSNVANSSYSLCNVVPLSAGYNMSFGAYFNWYMYAYYVRNTYTLQITRGSSSSTSTPYVNALASAAYYYAPTGYDSTGFKVQKTVSGTVTVAFYNSSNTAVDSKAYTTSYNSSTGYYEAQIPYNSSASYVKISYPGGENAYGFNVYLTATYTPKIYTFTLNLDSTKTFVNSGTTNIYYKYDNGFYLESSCTNKMTNNANPITLPIAVGYKVESQYTFVQTYTYGLITSTGYCQWYSSSDITSMNSFVINGLRSATSSWTPIKYTIKYPSGCTTDGSSQELSITATYGSVVTIPAPVGMFYDFNGFSVSGASSDCTHYYGSTTSTTGSFTETSKSLSGYPSYVYFKNLWGTVDASKAASSSHGTVTLTGNWLGKKYNVAFNMNGGDAISTITNCRYGTPYTLCDADDVYKVGYNFAGWDVSGMDTTATNPLNSNSVNITHYFTPSGGTQISCTTATKSLDASYKDCTFQNLRGTYVNGATQTVTFSAKWTPITYNIVYSLTNGINEAGVWSGSETHPATAVYEQSFAVDIPDREGWPVGYDFTSWYITGLGSGAQSCPTQDGDYWYVNDDTLSLLVSKRQYFKNLAADEGDTITFQARWTAHKYKISYVANGENVTLSSSSPTELAYDSNARVYKPSRKGYTFAGWALSELSDEVTHYYHTGSSWVTSSQVAFESTNGKYLNPNNPNEFNIVGSGTYFRIKNLHYVSGATVVLTAQWTPNTYTITYHYTVDADYTSYQTKDALNKAGNQVRTKAQSAVFDQYFKTYMGGAVETATTMQVPTGFKIAGWYFLMNGSAASSLNTETYGNNNPQLVFLPNADVLFDYDFALNCLVTGTDVTNVNAYAIYEPINFTLKYYLSTDTSKVNDLSTYAFDSQVSTTFGGSVTLLNPTGRNISNWLVSANLYVDGGINYSYRTITYNSVTKYTYAGVTLNWGLSNTLAHDPENPVFYLYGESNADYDPRSLSSLTFTRVADSTNGDYWTVKAKSTSITGDVYIPNRYNNGTYDLPVRQIVASAFSSISTITSVYIPRNIQSIGNYAFNNCDCLLSVTFEENSALKSIGSYAFRTCMFASFVMPNSVSSIGDNCFASCSAMTSLTLSTSLQTLPYNFISGTSKLTSLTIPNSVTTIQPSAFYGTSITSLTIPASVTSFGYQYSHKFTSITVDSNNKFYDSRNNCNAVMKTSDDTLVMGCVNTTIPDDTKIIGDYAFEAVAWKAGETATLPEGLTEICEYAFAYSKFTGMILPSTLTIINFAAFQASAITDIILPNVVSYIGDNAFEGSALTSIVIPGDKNPYVGCYAFRNCASLEFVIFKYGITEIYSYTIMDCPNLEFVYIPSSVAYAYEGAISADSPTIYVGLSESDTSSWDDTWWSGNVIYNSDADTAFQNFLANVYPDWDFYDSTEDWVTVIDYTGSATSVTIPAVVDDVNLGYAGISTGLINVTSMYVGTNVKSFKFDDYGSSKLETLTLSPGLKTLPDYAFDNLRKLTSLTIPYTVENIGKYLFSTNSKLTSIIVDERNPYYDSRDNCNAIIKTATNTLVAGSGCSTISTTVEVIATGAFASAHISNLVVPGNVKVIEENSIVLLNFVSLVLEEGVKTIEQNAINVRNTGSGATISISIPSTVSYIGTAGIAVRLTDNISITVDSDNPVYDSRNSCNAIIETATNTIICGFETTTIPSTVTEIGQYAFQALSMPSSFTIPSSVTLVDEYAFKSATFAGNVSLTSVTKVSDYAFERATFNGNLTLGSKLIEIGERAFSNSSFSAQTSIEIPSSTKVVGNYAFAYVEAKFVFNEGLQKIGNNAFYGNDTATSITIPNSVVEIGESAFSYMTSLVSIDIGSGITKIPVGFVWNSPSLTSIVIPDSVTDIDSSAFRECPNVLGTVIIPDSVVRIGAMAFYRLGSNGDVDVVFGKNLTTIEQFAFNESGIKEVILGDAVTVIGNRAFMDCSQLTYANLGNGAMSIESYGFANCSNLADVVFSDNTTNIRTYAFYYCSAIKKLNLPQNTNLYIDSYAFSYCTGITSLEIVYARTINYYAFRYCTSLKYVWMGSGVTNIYASTSSNSPFYGCSALTAIYTNVSSNPTNWGTYWRYKSTSAATTNYNKTIANYYGVVYPDFEFSGSYGSIVLEDYTGTATTVYVPSFVVETGTFAFEANKTMTKIVFPDGFKVLGGHTFYGATALTEVVLPNTLTTIDSGVFNGCMSLSSITIPNGVTSIGNRAFQSSKIVSLHIPASVTSLGTGLLYWTGENGDYTTTDNPHRYLTVDPANTVYDSRDNCNAVIETATNKIVLGTQITTIPGSVTSVGYEAFVRANFGEKLTLPANVKTIDDYAFYDCDFVSIDMQGVETIGYYSFYGNNTLKELVLPETLVSFEIDYGNSFGYNSALETVILPESLVNLGTYTFSNCDALKNVYIPKNITEIGQRVFANCDALEEIHIPANITSIGEAAFYSCGSLKTVNMENGCTSIGKEAFYSCEELVTMNLSTNLKTIGNRAFYRCEKMTTCVIPAGVTLIEEYAFAYCKALTYLWIPSGASITASSTTSGPFNQCSSSLKIYTNASSKMSAWGTYWNYYISNATLSVTYSSSYSTYFNKLYPKYSVFTSGNELYLSYYSGSESTVNIPHGINIVANYAFDANNYVQTVTFPSSVSLIAYYAFYNCSNLTTVTLSEGVQQVSTDMIYGTNNLTTLNLPSTLTNFGVTEMVENFTSLSTVNVAEGNNIIAIRDGYVIELKSNKLLMPINRNLASYTIPEYTEEIGQYAFASITSYNGALVIPANVVEIEDYAFAYSPYIESITFETGSKLKIIGNYAFFNMTAIETLSLPEGLEIIGIQAFGSALGSGLTISIPKTVKSIGYGAFNGNITSISVADGNSYYSDGDVGVLIELITKRLIAGNSGLTTIPTSVKTIGPFAFMYMFNSSNTTISIPANVTAIDAYAFSYCSKLTSVTFAEGLKEISYYAFAYCTSLTTLVFPNSLEHIDNNAFNNCSSLATVYVGNNVKFICGDSYSTASFYGAKSSLVIYCADKSKPSSWGTYWNYVTSSVQATVVWSYDVASVQSSYVTGASAVSAYTVTSVDTANTGHFGNVSYDVETAVESVSRDTYHSNDDENVEEIA